MKRPRETEHRPTTHNGIVVTSDVAIDGRPVYNVWHAAPSAQTRWPDKQGVVLLKHIWSIYVIDKSRTCAYFDDNGTRLLRRHCLNLRDVDGMAEEMADAILRVGVQSDKRGRPILMPSRDAGEIGFPGAAFTFRPSEKFWVIGGGTMVDGVYIAAARGPQNNKKWCDACPGP